MELVTCQTLIEKEQRHPFLTIVFRGERGMSHWALTEAGVRGKNFLDNEEFGFGNDPQTTALQGEKLRQAHARLLQRMTELLEILQSPSQELLSKCRQWDIETEESDRHLLATAAAAALVKANHINKTRIACTAMALAAERYRLETGKWPDTLSALVPRFIDIVLSDPFEGLPLRYLQLSDGIVIYSPGFDGEDNGGVLGHMATNDPHTDIGFKLLDLNKRHGDSGSP